MSAILVLVAGIVLVALIKLWRTQSPRYLSPLRHLRGPRAPSLLFGHLTQLSAPHQALSREWVNEYGPSVKLRGFFNAPSLFTTDMKAIHHILTHSIDYGKPADARRILARLSGPAGVLITEGEHHRNQRRVMNPAFGPMQVRELVGVFHEKSLALRDYWMGQVSEDGCIRSNVSDGISKMTLDVIGVAGFNYDFETLRVDKPTNDVNRAFQELFQTPIPRNTLALLGRVFPLLFTLFPTERGNKAAEALAVMRRFGMQLIQEKKKQIMAEKASRSVEKKDFQGRDILSLLIKSNMASDIPESQRLTDEDVLAQVPTFLAAGHETTATATGWLLCELSKHPEFQRKLREELLSVESDTPTMEELNDLPYLGKCDDVIPVSEPFVDASGKLQHAIGVSRGNRVMISISALQTAKTIWGADALEFKPDRRDNPPEAITNMPGVWSHLLTFLGGTRACIGYRFSLVELKALIFALLRAFEFELTAPAEDVQPIGGFIQRAGVRGQEVAALPLLIRPYKRI